VWAILSMVIIDINLLMVTTSLKKGAPPLMTASKLLMAAISLMTAADPLMASLNDEDQQFC
jgi:hypothetical protein